MRSLCCAWTRSGSWQAANVPLPEMHLVGLAALWALHRVRPAAVPRRAKVQRVVGAVLVAAGVAIVARSVAAAGQVDLEHAGRLVTTGPYAVSRNPMYLAWALIHLGVGVGIGSAWTVVTLPAAVASIDREIAREERWLAQRFGEEFADYRAVVPRYLPRTRVWKIRRRPLGSVG